MVIPGTQGETRSSTDRPLRRERSIAIKAARAAGAAIKDVSDRLTDTGRAMDEDTLERARQAARRILMERIGAAFPGDAVVADQDPAPPTTDLGTRTWLLGPLDGDRAFLEGIPEFVVSIALVDAGRPVLAVVYDPTSDLLVTATRGAGVSGGPRPESTRHAKDLRQAVVAVDRTEMVRGRWAPFEGAFAMAPNGSGAYRSALVAFGMADATVSLVPQPMSVWCAGALLVEEAGGRVSALDGGPLDLSRPAGQMGGMIAGQASIFPALLAVVRAAGGGPVGVGDGRPGALASVIVAASTVPQTLDSPVAQPVALGETPVDPAHRVGPRITRPEPSAAPFVIATPTPSATDGPRPAMRTAVIYALLISSGILLGFLLADMTRGARGEQPAIPAAAATPGVLATARPSLFPSLLPTVPPSAEAVASATATPASTAASRLAPPVATLGDRLTANGVELDLAWQPPIDGGAVSRYDLQVSRDGAAFRTLDLAAKTSRSATVSAAADHDYVFRLRSRTSDGTPDPWVSSGAHLARHEESGPDVRASKGWKLAEHPDYTGDGALMSSTKDAELSLAFEGTAVGIIGPKGPGRGRADVFVDGERVGRFDAKAASFQPVTLLLAVDGLAAGPHVLSVRVLGTADRPLVAVDRFLVLS